jgi:hypothetical protein
VLLGSGVEVLDAMQKHARSVIESTLLSGMGLEGCWKCWFCVVWVSLVDGIDGRCGCDQCSAILCWGCV